MLPRIVIGFPHISFYLSALCLFFVVVAVSSLVFLLEVSHVSLDSTTPDTSQACTFVGNPFMFQSHISNSLLDILTLHVLPSSNLDLFNSEHFTLPTATQDSTS